MKNRFRRTHYTIEDIKLVDGHLRYVRNEDGTLFAGSYKTKIKPEDLPEWYLYGRYYKRFGYMSTKGITDMVYIPSRFSNHYLKDDFLLISYGGKITEVEYSSPNSFLDRFEGWDERVWGSDIVTILRGARRYSKFDITPFIEKLKWKKEWLQSTFPDEFGPEKWDIDVNQMFESENCPCCKSELDIKSVIPCEDGGSDVLALCNDCLRTWRWHCDATGRAQALEQYFFG